MHDTTLQYFILFDKYFLGAQKLLTTLRVPYIILESNFGKDKNFTKPEIVQEMIDILTKNEYTPFPTLDTRRLKEGALDAKKWQKWLEPDMVWMHKSVIKTKTVTGKVKNKSAAKS